MKKIFWFSNERFSATQCTGSGTWLGAMCSRLIKDKEFKLYNIVCVRGGNRIEHEEFNGIDQWLVPYTRLDKTGLPPKYIINSIVNIVNEVKPDMIHVWGLENYFGLLVSRGFLKVKSLIDIQGIRHAVAKYYTGNMNVIEQLSCIGIKELIKPYVSIWGQQRYFSSTKKHEIEIIRSFDYISYQSEWSKNYLLALNAKARLFKTKRMLRSEFYMSDKWHIQNKNDQVIYVSCGATLPYKGLFVVLRAVALLRSLGRFHNLKLRVAGDVGDGWLRSPGYYKWIKRMIGHLQLSDCVELLGRRTAAQMCDDLRSCAVFIHPSFIESYSLVVAEAMYLGVPCVISYAGAMPERAEDGRSALYYPAGDEYICAGKIMQILDDTDFAETLSANALQKSRCENEKDDVLATQMAIYDEVLRT